VLMSWFESCRVFVSNSESSPSDSWTYSSSTLAVSSLADSIFVTSLTGTPSTTFKSMQSTNLYNLLLNHLYPLLLVSYPKKMPSSALSSYLPRFSLLFFM
jgi:hypothetical protein